MVVTFVFETLVVEVVNVVCGDVVEVPIAQKSVSPSYKDY